MPEYIQDTTKFVRRAIAPIVIALLVSLIGCDDSIDDKIRKFRGPNDRVVGLRSMSDVIANLGPPKEVWGSSVGSDIVFIYQGREAYSILFVAGQFPLRIVNGRLGGKGAVPLSEPFDFNMHGNSIDLRRR
jgi:hypothetical protein